MQRNPLNDIFSKQKPQQPPQSVKNPFQMLQDFQKFASGMTPEKAQQQVQELLASGKMSQQQYQDLQRKAKQFMDLLGLK